MPRASLREVLEEEGLKSVDDLFIPFIYHRFRKACIENNEIIAKTLLQVTNFDPNAIISVGFLFYFFCCSQ
jgi:hypothetical protein